MHRGCAHCRLSSLLNLHVSTCMHMHMHMHVWHMCVQNFR